MSRVLCVGLILVAAGCPGPGGGRPPGSAGGASGLHCPAGQLACSCCGGATAACFPPGLPGEQACLRRCAQLGAGACKQPPPPPPPTVLASDVCPTSVAVDATRVYFTSNVGTTRVVESIDKNNGGAPTVIASSNDTSTVVDPVFVWNGNVYWIQKRQYTSTLFRALPDGGAPVALDSDEQSVPRQVTRNVLANDAGVYWADENRGISRETATGPLLITPPTYHYGSLSAAPYPTTLGLDGTNVYFTSNDATSATLNLLNSIPVAGGFVTTLAAVPAAAGLIPLAYSAIVADGHNVYWASTGQAPGQIMRVSVPELNQTVFARTFDSTAMVTSLAIDGTHLYWTENQTSGSIAGQALAGGQAIPVAVSQSYPLSIAIDDRDVYWANAGVSVGTLNDPPVPMTCSGSVMKTPKL